ncbi:MAG TPA: cytidylate kinase-like family protein [Clostridia bacterium]|nr:cytidylate kinase-like family protein [Clostridia bacterium]
MENGRNFVITVARSCGSGGGEIARSLAAEFNINYYDRKLLRLASDDSGINEKLFAQADEQVQKTNLFKVSRSVYNGELIPPQSEYFLSNQNLFNYQAKVIKGLADSESCVVIGRCADFVLRDYDNVLHVYIHAPLEACIRRKMRATALTESAMRTKILKTDELRANYYRHYTGQPWNLADQYDLSLNSETLGIGGCIALIKSYVKLKFF